jgi:hypothetical protein
MRHLLSNAINPVLPLKLCLREWPALSAALGEGPRARRLQIVSLGTYLS